MASTDVLHITDKELEKRILERTTELVRENELLKGTIHEQRITEEELRRKERRLRNLFHTSREAILLVNQQSASILDANPAACRLYQYSPEELLALKVTDLSAEPEKTEESLRRSISDVPLRLHRKKDGTVFPVEISGGYFEEEGLRLHTAFIRDISERKRIEEEIVMLKHSIDINRDGAYWIDRDGRFVYVNDAACKALGWKREELIGKTLFEVNIEATAEDMKATWDELRARGSFIGESVHRRKDGTEFPVEITTTYVQFAGREFACGFARDVSERRAMEAALRESEAKFRSYVERSPLAVVVIDETGVAVDVNRAAVKLAGYDRKTVLGAHLWEILPEDDRPMGFGDFATLARKGHYEGQYRIQKKDGSFIWVSAMATVLGNRHFLIYCRDITKQKKADEALKRYELLSGHSRDIILFLTTDGNILEANTAAEKAYGYTREELRGLTIHDLRDEETAPLTTAQLAQANRKGILFEAVHRRKDGSTFPVEVSSRGATIEGRRALVSVVRDITERKAVEKELTFLKHSVDVLRDSAFWLDSDNRLVYLNDAACRSIGYAREDVIGKEIYEIVPTRTPQAMKEVWEHLRKSGSYTHESFSRRRDGSEFPCEVDLSYIQFGGREFACGFAKDVTEKQKLEEQLRQAQKMEAIGTLAGGVAHDFNNILMVILGFGNIIQMSLGPDDRNRPHIDQIVLSAERAAELTRSLLAFSRRQRISLEPHEVDSVVANAAKLLRRLLTEDIGLKVELTAGRAIAMLDVAQMDQVLMNLATNARDAMPAGGSLLIRTGLAQLDTAFYETHGFGRPGSYVRLSVIDSGLGMDERTMARIFDPFFTTKETGKGTGLGLASVYGIVKQHGGYITVESAMFKGATFDIYIPLVDGAVREANAASLAIIGGSETILVIEDDRDVRNMVTRVLSNQGYHTLEAGDGDEAIGVFNEHREKISLVILDVVMPGRNGRQVFDEIALIDRGIKAIFMSGYTGDVVIDKGIEKEKVEFLQKPLSVAKLLAKVREVLDRQPE